MGAFGQMMIRNMGGDLNAYQGNLEKIKIDYKKIKWKKPKGGRISAHILEGWVDDKKCFHIEGRLCVTDLRPMDEEPWRHPVHYHLEDEVNRTDEAKQIAYEVLNGLNVEKHEANLEKQRIKNEHTLKVIKDAQDFLDSLKNI